MKNILMTLTALTLTASLVYASNDVKDACASDLATTGCTGEGKAQINCLHEYKKANKDFKFSEGCKVAFKEHKEERKQKRDERKAKREAGKEEKKDTK